MLQQREVQAGPVPASWLKVESITDGLGFARLRNEWTTLLEASDASIFNGWEWLYPWYRRIAPEREPRILLARDGEGALVGLMPLAIETRRPMGRRVRRLSFLGDTHVGSDYLDVVARRGMEESVARAFALHLRQATDWDVLDLLDLDSRSVTLRVFQQELAGPGYRCAVEDRFLCPYELFVPGQQFDAFLRNTGRRDNYLRRRRWFERQSGFHLDKVDDPELLARPISEFFRLHHMRWAEDGGSQGIKGAGVEAFHRDAAQLLAERKKVRLYTLFLGDRALASVYGIFDRGKFLYYQSGYDPAWRGKSVGLVLVGETFRDAIEAGCREYDFLRGTEPYKAEWTTLQRRTSALRIWRKGRGGWLVGSENAGRSVRNAAKAILPGNLVEKIRRLRRRRMALQPV